MPTKNVLRFVAASAVLAAACSKTETAKVDTTTPSAAPAPAPTAAASPSSDSLVLVRGSVASVSATQLIVKTDSASVTVNTPQAVHVYTRGPSDLSHVSDKTFIGVTTVRQADGSEKATEIHIFPEELRGLGEGSRPIAPAGGGATPSKMTNGAASTMTNGSASTMTNGSASTMTNGSASKMTNGAASTNGKTIVVNFAGGSTTAVVPPGTSITEIKPTDKKLAAGDQVVVVATRGADGNLMSTRVMMAK